MKILLFIALVIASGIAREVSPDNNALHSVLSLILGVWIIYLIVRFFIWASKGKSGRRPPTDRQLDFIDALIEEREVEAWMLEKEPKTVKEASELITALQNQPYREERLRPASRSRAKSTEDDADITI